MSQERAIIRPWKRLATARPSAHPALAGIAGPSSGWSTPAAPRAAGWVVGHAWSVETDVQVLREDRAGGRTVAIAAGRRRPKNKARSLEGLEPSYFFFLTICVLNVTNLVEVQPLSIFRKSVRPMTSTV